MLSSASEINWSMRKLIVLLLLASLVVYAECESKLSICDQRLQEMKMMKVQAEDEAMDARKRLSKKGATVNEIFGYIFLGLLTGFVIGSATNR